MSPDLPAWSYSKNAEDVLVVRDSAVAVGLLCHANTLAKYYCTPRSAMPKPTKGVSQ